MSTLGCCIVILCGILIFVVAVAENNKFQDERDEHHFQLDEVKSSDEAIERIRRQIGAFGIGAGFYGGRHVDSIGNPYYGAPYGNSYITSMIADLEPTTVSVDISMVARQILCSTSVDVDLIKLNIKIYKHCG